MTRYEAWRSEADAPGPQAQPLEAHRQLNSAFFVKDQASTLSRPYDPDDITGWRSHWVTEPYDRLVQYAQNAGNDGGTYSNYFVWVEGQAGEGRFRYPSGRRERFHAQHDDEASFWSRLHVKTSPKNDNPDEDVNPGNSPQVRVHWRIRGDWPYSTQWTAADPEWTGNGRDRHHTRALRDAFYRDYDAEWDAVDGMGDPEYGGLTGTENPTGDQLAGRVRGIWLEMPGYGGPKVP